MARSTAQSDHKSRNNSDELQRIPVGNVVRGKGMLEEAAIEPVVSRVDTRFSENGVTFKQVVPMVIVLTSATFLFVSGVSLDLKWMSYFIDNVCSSNCYRFNRTFSKYQYSSDSPAMGDIFLCIDLWLIPTPVGQAWRCVWQKVAVYSRCSFHGCDLCWERFSYC